jgi:uncharacterized protein (TIGR01777 family)
VMKALVTGATGLVGRELLRRLESPHVLTRSPTSTAAEVGAAAAWSWQPEREPAPAAAFAGVDTIFHLAGEPVAEGRWTAEKKQRIESSRVLGTRHLVSTLAQLTTRPAVLVCASAIGYYGERGDELLDESSTAGAGFLARVCREWEAEALQAEQHGVRVVLARLGIVLAPRGGALARMLPPFRLGLGGKLGSGRQWMSWVQLSDVTGLLLHAAAHPKLRGPLNVVSPAPLSNAEFTRALGHALGRPALLSVPRLALSLALGEVSEVVLESQRVVPRVARDTGYEFMYPELGAALAACLGTGEVAS